MPRRVVITGTGVFSPVGIGLDAYVQALMAGSSGVKPVARFEVGDFPVRVASLPAGSGQAQDLAHVFIACCRHLGVPARYACGYVYLREHAGEPSVGHSWAEAWVEDRWRSFDIWLGSSIDERHVKVAMGADHLDACPIRGVRIGGDEESMTVDSQLRQQQG